MKIIYVMGVTCVGKSTFLSKAKEIMGDRVGLVEVGKEMRKRYPPERFRGLAAMPDTEDEAIEIYQDQLREAYRAECDYVLVDGQPRMVSQIPRVLEFYPLIEREAWWLHMDMDVLKGRAEDRFPDDEASYDLCVQRMTNDVLQLYPVVWELLNSGMVVKPILHHSMFDYDHFWKSETTK